MRSKSSVFPELVLCSGNFGIQDPTRLYDTGVAVTDGVLTAVGDDDVRAMAGCRTRIIDLEGRLMLPGFIDSHLHYRQRSLGLKTSGSAVRRAGRAASHLVKCRPGGSGQGSRHAGPGDYSGHTGGHDGV